MNDNRRETEEIVGLCDIYLNTDIAIFIGWEIILKIIEYNDNHIECIYTFAIIGLIVIVRNLYIQFKSFVCTNHSYQNPRNSSDQRAGQFWNSSGS